MAEKKCVGMLGNDFFSLERKTFSEVGLVNEIKNAII